MEYVNIILLHKLSRPAAPDCKPKFMQSGELVVDLLYNMAIIHVFNSMHILDYIGVANYAWWGLSTFSYSYYVTCGLFYIEGVFHERKENSANSCTACLTNSSDFTAI